MTFLRRHLCSLGTVVDNDLHLKNPQMACNISVYIYLWVLLILLEFAVYLENMQNTQDSVL
jgi:hypothetical protein